MPSLLGCLQDCCAPGDDLPHVRLCVLLVHGRAGGQGPGGGNGEGPARVLADNFTRLPVLAIGQHNQLYVCAYQTSRCLCLLYRLCMEFILEVGVSTTGAAS